MSILKYSVDIDLYTIKNALLWGNCLHHAKERMKGTLGNRIVHWIIAAIEFLPIVSQIASLFEMIIVFCVIKKLSNEDGILSYIGEVKEGKMNGKGVFSSPDGRKYNGYFKNDNPHGHGVFSWSSGSKYEGDFENGKSHGHGVFTYSDGKKYEGDFKKGKRDGRGIYTDLDRSQCEWVYKNGKLIEAKVYTESDGSKDEEF